MQLLQVLRLDVGVGLALLCELDAKPRNGALFVGDEQRKLLVFQIHLGAALVVLIDLVGKEEHSISLDETLTQTGIEGVRVHRHGNAIHDVERDHAVKEQVILPLGDDLNLAGRVRRNRHVL